MGRIVPNGCTKQIIRWLTQHIIRFFEIAAVEIVVTVQDDLGLADRKRIGRIEIDC